MDELQPLLPSDLKNIKVRRVAVVPFLMIHTCSLLNFFSPFFRNILVLSSATAKYLLPFILNIFTETHFVLFIIDPVCAIILVNTLMRFWNIQQIVMFGCCAALISTTIAWLMLAILGLDFHINGSMPVLIAWSEAVAYACGDAQEVATFTEMPGEFFAFLAVLLIGTLSFANLGGVISVFISYALLCDYQHIFKFPKNDHFGPQSFLKKSKAENSFVEIPSNTQLSEDDQNRRMRALRAIEERLEGLQSRG